MTLNDYLVGIRWHDVIVVGAGHNGLVAALFLARKGLKVLVLEERDAIGGAACTERPFSRAPDLAVSTGAQLFGLMPPELLAKIGIELPLVRRDPHTFLPEHARNGRDAGYVVLGSDREATKRALASAFSEADSVAYDAIQTELAALCDDVAKTWLEAPQSIEETAAAYVRAPLQRAFVDLCRGSVGDYVARWGIPSDRLRALFRVNAGLAGADDPWSTPGTGMRLLSASMGRLPGSGGGWMALRGGMGILTRTLADEAIRLGVSVQTEAKVGEIVVENGVAKGVVLKDGTMHHATAVVCNADPFRMRELLSKSVAASTAPVRSGVIPADDGPQVAPSSRHGSLLPPAYDGRLDAYARDGGAMKVCLAMSSPPDFASWPEGAYRTDGFGATAYLLPPEGEAMRALDDAYAAVAQGRLAETPAVLFDLEPPLDPEMEDAGGLRSASLFVAPVPYSLAGTTWDARENDYVERLFSICDQLAPGFRALVVDTFILHPAKLEAHFGLTRGHVQHVDNAFGFADRLPYATPVQGLYSCSAGTHPAGGVVGAAGHNAAMRVLADLGKGSARPDAV